mgnify:CR=1 FL=1
MNKKSFDIYLEFNYLKLNLAAFNKLNSQIEYYKEQLYKPYINSDQELNFDELQKLVEKNIIEEYLLNFNYKLIDKISYQDYLFKIS